MSDVWPYLGDLGRAVEPPWAQIILVVCSAACGMLVGAERELNKKPAGLRTVTLICLGSTIFTLASISLAGEGGNHTYIAAHVVTGVGFLGAGALIQDRGMIIGLTTAASIWNVAAIGLMIGGGYAAAGIALTALVVATLTAERWLERRLQGRCRFSRGRVTYMPDGGKTFIWMRHLLDNYGIPDGDWHTWVNGDMHVLELRHCDVHPMHRSILRELADIECVLKIEAVDAAQPGEPPECCERAIQI